MLTRCKNYLLKDGLTVFKQWLNKVQGAARGTSTFEKNVIHLT